MTYTTIEDVEARLGHGLDDGELTMTLAFIQDFEAIIASELVAYDKTPADVSENLLRMVVARKAVDYFFYRERGGASSFSQAVGDTSSSASFSSNPRQDFFKLTQKDKKILGLSSSGFVTWRLTER